MVDNVVVIMAGGLGKRMKSDLPKVLHKVMDKPMLVHVIERALEIKPIKIYIVVGKYMPIIKDTLYHYDMLDYVEFINQPEALGTGHAIQCCRPYLYQHEYSNTLILSGDVPLIKTIGGPIQIKIDFYKIKEGILEKMKDYVKNNKIFLTDKFLQNKDFDEKVIKLIASATYNNILKNELFVLNIIDQLVKK